MNIPCCTPPSLCQDPSESIGNFSSEAPDTLRCYGRNYGTGLFPPLGSDWTSSGCVGDCTVELTEDQVLAGNTCSSSATMFQTEECAQRANIECLSDDWPGTDGDGNPVPRITFTNDEQSCDFTCPDGSVFTYTVPQGTFLGFSRANANNIAYSAACNRAAAFRICIGEFTTSAWCLNEFNQATVDFVGPVNNYTSSIVSGSLPPGLSYFQDGQRGVVSGTPTIGGAFEFALRVQDPMGNFMVKSFTINVVEISPSSMPDGGVGSAYSQALSTNVGNLSSQTWSIVSGSLPPGVTLGPFPASVLQGTPTTPGTFTFTVRVVDTSL